MRFEKIQGLERVYGGTAATRCETCNRIADFGGVSCRACHEAACEAFGLGGPICLPGETEWQARLRRAGVRIDTEK